jgi:hypothetical protein
VFVFVGDVGVQQSQDGVARSVVRVTSAENESDGSEASAECLDCAINEIRRDFVVEVGLAFDQRAGVSGNWVEALATGDEG